MVRTPQKLQAAHTNPVNSTSTSGSADAAKPVGLRCQPVKAQAPESYRLGLGPGSSHVPAVGPRATRGRAGTWR